MLATWILCIFFILIAPYLLLEAGVLRARKCAKLGAPRGYRSELARSSQAAWTYAQKVCSTRYILGGIIMAIAALAIICVVPVDTISSLYIFTAIKRHARKKRLLFLSRQRRGKRIASSDIGDRAFRSDDRQRGARLVPTPAVRSLSVPLFHAQAPSFPSL